jgi:hypothetical protein
MKEKQYNRPGYCCFIEIKLPTESGVEWSLTAAFDTK